MTEKKKILIAEDDANILEVMRIILTDNGYAVNAASSGESVVKKASEIRPHLIFLDINLGGVRGEDIAKALQENAITRTIPFVILSADSETEEIAKEVNAHGFLLKPFEIDSLLSTVQQHIK